MPGKAAHAENARTSTRAQELVPGVLIHNSGSVIKALSLFPGHCPLENKSNGTRRETSWEQGSPERRCADRSRATPGTAVSAMARPGLPR